VVGELNSSVAQARDFAATWRDQDDRIVGFIPGGTMCWEPRLSQRVRIEREGFQHIIRCGKCEGCRELDRRRLQDRLRAHYKDFKSTLWIVHIDRGGPLAAALCHNLHRRPALELEPGFFRCGPGAVAVLARNKSLIKAALQKFGTKPEFERVHFSRGGRAWRSLSAGLLHPRETYGENTNRYYCRGLPKAEKLSWEVNKIPYQKGYNRFTSPRAWKNGELVLVPAEVWKLGRNGRRMADRAMRSGPSSTQAAAIIRQVVALMPKSAGQSQLEAAPKGRLTREQVQAWYRRMAEQKAASSPSGSASEIFPPLSEVGGYRTSVHFISTETPKLLSDEQLLEVGPSGIERWREREQEKERLRGQREAETKAKIMAEQQAIIARMEKLAKERGRGG
jgi:hypothetical protein